MRVVLWIIRWNINKTVTWFASPLTSWIGGTSPGSSLPEGRHWVQCCYSWFALMKVKKNWLYFERWYCGSCWKIMKLLDWLFKVSCYSLVYVRAELTLTLYDKLVFILEHIYIYIYNGINMSYEWDGDWTMTERKPQGNWAIWHGKGV